VYLQVYNINLSRKVISSLFYKKSINSTVVFSYKSILRIFIYSIKFIVKYLVTLLKITVHMAAQSWRAWRIKHLYTLFSNSAGSSSSRASEASSSWTSDAMHTRVATKLHFCQTVQIAPCSRNSHLTNIYSYSISRSFVWYNNMKISRYTTFQTKTRWSLVLKEEKR